MILTFFTSIVDEDGNVINSHKIIAREYFKLWFWIDLIAVYPF